MIIHKKSILNNVLGVEFVVQNAHGDFKHHLSALGEQLTYQCIVRLF